MSTGAGEDSLCIREMATLQTIQVWFTTPHGDVQKSVTIIPETFMPFSGLDRHQEHKYTCKQDIHTLKI